MSPKSALSLFPILLTLFSLASSQTITYLTCSTSADCIHYRYSVCNSGTCQSCGATPDCTHLNSAATCETDSISNYCSVPCASASSAGVCGSTNSICVNLAGLRCGSCQIASDCSTQYPSGVQCQTVNSVGYCGYCLDDYQCSSTQTCKNFKCTECSSNTDCPTNRPVCSITLKSNTCTCLSNANCPASAPSCTTTSSSSVAACYSVPTLTLKMGTSSDIVLVVFNMQMTSSLSFDELVTIKLVNVNSDLYSYTLTSLDTLTYQITLSPNTNIDSVTLSLIITNPDDLVNSAGVSLAQTDYTLFLGDLYLLPFYQVNAAESAARAGEVLSILLVSTSLFVLLLSRDSILFWVFMNYLQTMYYILFINEEYPYHLQMFLRDLYVGPYRFFPNVLTRIAESLDQDNLDSPDRFTDNGIGGLFLINIGHLIFVWLITLGVTGLIIIIERFFPISQPIETYFKKARQYMIWSGVIRVLLSTLNEFTFACFLQMSALTWDSGVHIISSLLGIFGTIFVCLVPFLFMFLLRKYGHFTASEKEKYEMLMDEYNPETPLGRFFLAINLGKRLAMCIFISFFSYTPLTVILILISLDILFIVLLGEKIHKKRIHTFIITAVEVVSAFIHMLILSLVIDDLDGQPEGEIRIWTAWGIIGTTLGALAASCTYALFDAATIIRKLLSEDDSGTNKKRRLVPVNHKVSVNLANHPLPRGSHIRSSVGDISLDGALTSSHLQDSTLNLLRASSSNLSMISGSDMTNDASTFGKDPIPFKPLKPVYLAVNQKGVRSSRLTTPRSSSMLETHNSALSPSVKSKEE